MVHGSLSFAVNSVLMELCLDFVTGLAVSGVDAIEALEDLAKARATDRVRRKKPPPGSPGEH